MKPVLIKTIIVALTIFYIPFQTNAQNDYFFPGTGSFDAGIPTPEKFLGYPVGSHFTRHDQIVAYFKELARLSDKAHFQVIGKTYEERPQVILTITSPENYQNIEQIRQRHLTLTEPAKNLIPESDPVVVLLGYSVHGAETSSGEAALLTAYYLVANQNEETSSFLKNAVILIDPSLNPDGRDRAANWHNGFKSFPPVSDPADLEHNQAWPGGRTNHYFTDLNRDWLSAEQIESKNRLEFFHKWYPNVHIDFHEMGTNSTYYFEPSPANHQSPIVPQASYDFNTTLARYQAAALDKIGSLYFTKENFDNLSPIYGSTYPDFFGAVGATFEQGSSRGLVQESTRGLVTFPFTIRNHVTTGIATVRGAVAEKVNLFKLQKDFFKSAVAQGKSNPAKAFVFGDSQDQSLTNKFLSLLLDHHLEVYNLSSDLTLNGNKFEKGQAYIVPSEQPFFRIVHSIFEETPALGDSVYYDNTSWSIIHAYGLQFAKLNSPSFTLGNRILSVPVQKGGIAGGKAPLAYILDWSDYNSSTFLNSLLDRGILVKTTFKPFTAGTSGGKKNFGYGSLIIPVLNQKIDNDSLYSAVSEAATNSGVTVYGVATGFSLEGIDLGSNNIRPVRKPKVALLSGEEFRAGEIGQVWFLLNQHLNLPVSKIDVNSLERRGLDRYNTLILVSGSYQNLSARATDQLKEWVNKGGTLITFKNATEWAIRQHLLRENVFVDSSETKGLKKLSQRIDYVNRNEAEASKRINGGIFLADIDITNPIAFGLHRRRIFFTKTGNTLLQPSLNRYSTVAQYLPDSYISGYVSDQNKKKVSNSAAILAGQSGRGVIIGFAEDPVYRHYWHGTDRLLINSIFFGNQIQLQSGFWSAEE